MLDSDYNFIPTSMWNKYFLEHDVFSDDPFTAELEPPVPFALGILVKNFGQGSAKAFTIFSAQPKIIEDLNGLIISFNLLRAEVYIDKKHLTVVGF